MIFIWIFMVLFVCDARVFYVKSIGANDVPHACRSMGLQYHAPLNSNSSFHRCIGNNDDPSQMNYHADANGISIITPSITKMSIKPAVKYSVLDSLSDAEKKARAWYIPIYPTNDNAYNANAYNVIKDGFRGDNVQMSVLGMYFATPSVDIPVFVNPYNAMDGSNNVYSNQESKYEHDSKVVSIFSGKGDCVDGLAPDTYIRPIKVMNEDGLLQSDYFSSALYLQKNEVQIRTFGPENTSPHYDDQMMDELVVETMVTSMERGGLYVVSGGNDGTRYNFTSARACFDSSIAGFHGLISVGVFNAAGAVPGYATRGCIFVSGPGGDEFHPMTLNDGFQCVASAGSSFSCPVVGALIALLQSICGNTLSNSDIQDIIVRTSRRAGLHDTHGIAGYQYLKNGANITYSDAAGFGYIDFRAAIKYVQENKCPHVSAITQCDTPIYSTLSENAQVNRFNIAFPRGCDMKRVKFVRLSAAFNVSLSSIVNWEVDSPAQAIPCTLLPLQHPYFDEGKIYHTGCWSFYNESTVADAVWTIRYTTLQPLVVASFGINFFGFI